MVVEVTFVWAFTRVTMRGGVEHHGRVGAADLNWKSKGLHKCNDNGDIWLLIAVFHVA